MRDSENRNVRRVVAAGLVAALFVVVACGSDGGPGGTDAEGAVPSGDAATTTAGAQRGPSEGPGTPEPLPLAETTHVRVAQLFNLEVFLPALLAEHFGEFAKENLDVEIVTMATNDATMAVARGDAQMKLAGITPAFFNSVASGVDLVGVANVSQTPKASKEGLWLRNEMFTPDGEVDVDKLRGATLALGTTGLGSVTTIPVSLFLAEHGLTLADVKVKNLGGAEMLVAVENGLVDGGTLLTPFWLETEKAGSARFVGSYGGTEDGGFSANWYEMSQTFIDEKPEVARAMLRAILRTVRTYLQGDYHANPEVLAAISEVLDVPEATILAAPAYYFDPEMGLDASVVELAQDVWIEFVPDALSYSEPLPVSAVTDHRIVDEVLAGR